MGKSTSEDSNYIATCMLIIVAFSYIPLTLCAYARVPSVQPWAELDRKSARPVIPKVWRVGKPFEVK